MNSPTPAAPGNRERRLALVTGAGRTAGIGWTVARQLGASGWDVAFTYYGGYDERMPWGVEPDAPAELAAALTDAGAAHLALEADLADPAAPARIFDEVERNLGPVSALVMVHCESVRAGLLDTSVESFDRHFAVNARAPWLLIREFGRRFTGEHRPGRVIAFTGDHTVGHISYGASKAALDRITLAAADELAHLDIRANVINPGPVDTGWMTDDVHASGIAQTPAGRVGTPGDCANLVEFLCSDKGEWINGQLLYSNGGFGR